MKKLENKIALITGGNSGIGLATSKLFYEEGAKVIITASSKESYEKAKFEYGSLFDIVQTDVTKNLDLDRLFDHIKTKYHGLDILFANAGILKFRPFIEINEDLYDLQFNTNLRSLFFTVQKAVPILNLNSSVILNSSTIGNMGISGFSTYCATKAAIRSFARSWTAEIPSEKARFNVLSPGLTETSILNKTGLQPDKLQHLSESLKLNIPAKRFGTAEEIAKVVLFLATPDSSYILGSEIISDGGWGNV